MVCLENVKSLYKNYIKRRTTRLFMRGFVGRREEFLPEAHGLSRTVTTQIPQRVLGHSHYRRLALAPLLVPYP